MNKPLKKINKDKYKLHTYSDFWFDRRTYEDISDDDKMNLIYETIKFFEVMLLQYKGYDSEEIGLMMLIDDNYVMKVEDTDDEKMKPKIEKVIHTLHSFSSMLDELNQSSDD